MVLCRRETMGADGAFDRRRKELALIAGRNEDMISEDEVSQFSLSLLALALDLSQVSFLHPPDTLTCAKSESFCPTVRDLNPVCSATKV